LRQLDWASRDMRRRLKEVEATTRELATTLQRAPDEAEVAERLGMDVERLRSLMVDLRNVGLVSASARPRESEDLAAPDFPAQAEGQPDWIYARAELRSTLSDALKKLPERYQRAVLLYYENEMTMKEIGAVLGVKEPRIADA
jgi:RNA polymerase sigma factor for flagellar operon FliA